MGIAANRWPQPPMRIITGWSAEDIETPNKTTDIERENAEKYKRTP